MGSNQSHPELTTSSSSSSSPVGLEEDSSNILVRATPLLVNSPLKSDGNSLSNLGDGVLRSTRAIHRVAIVSYAEFLANIKELNEISSHFLDFNGKQLVFAVKKGTDSTILWKATVRVACVKVDTASKKIDSYRTFNLKEFLLTYARLKNQSVAFGASLEPPSTEGTTSHSGDDATEAQSVKKKTLVNFNQLIPGPSGDPQNASTSGVGQSDSVDGASCLDLGLEECCICLERKPELILPCAHSYCLPCIEQWSVDHHTCPVCRETVSSTDEGWVLGEEPDSMEIATEIQKALMDLTQ